MKREEERDRGDEDPKDNTYATIRTIVESQRLQDK